MVGGEVVPQPVAMPGSASADVSPINASDCPSSLAIAFSRQIRNEPSLCSSITLRHTTLRMQAGVDKVVRRSQQARLTLNAAKCEVAFFSLDNAEAQWRPQITINGVPPSCTPSPTFLGVTYDRHMTFGTLVKKVFLQMLRRTNLLRVVGGTTWGWQKQDLRTVYIATQRSVTVYAAAAWTPWLSSSNIEMLEGTQLQAARAITSAPRQQRLSCMKLTFSDSNIGLRC